MTTTDIPTPLTDAVGKNGGYYRSKEKGWYIPIDFARDLERKLTSAQSRNKTLSSRHDRLCDESTSGDEFEAAIEQAMRIANGVGREDSKL